MMFHEETKPTPDEWRVTKAVAPFVALKIGLKPEAEVRFVQEVLPSRDAFWTDHRAVGFVRSDVVYVHTGLTPRSLARTIGHECAHIRQVRVACETLRVTQSVAIDERGARLVELELFGDLSSRATFDEVIDYVKQQESKLLRARFAPLVERASVNRLALLKSKGLRISGVEYR
jgi:hypothetical protein